MLSADVTNDESYEAKEPAGKTTFRAAEKLYQLHYEQKFKFIRQGRKRGGKLVPQPTDLSQVIDIRNPAGTAATVQRVACQLFSGQDNSGGQASQGGSSTALALTEATALQDNSGDLKAVTFANHPGLTVFPSALPGVLQAQLMRAALEEWPEPPACTNHTKAYGSLLSGLFSAAREGLALAVQPTRSPEDGPSNQPAADSECVEQQPQHCQLNGAQQQKRCQHATHRQEQQHCQQQSSLQRGCGQQQQHHDQHKQQQQCQPQQHSPSGCCGTSYPVNKAPQCSVTAVAEQLSSKAWSASGCGPKAAALLRKLRWTSLGPPFNWTDRVYEPDAPHPPLPDTLRAIACKFAGLAGRCDAATSGAGHAEAAQAGYEQTAINSAWVGRAATAIAETAAHGQRAAAAAADSEGSSFVSSFAIPAASGSSSGCTDSSAAQCMAAAVLQQNIAATSCSSSSSTSSSERAALSGKHCMAKPFHPDVALVNYYYAGDTLNGHKDDVEADVTQPIVTVSLGCQAVFLIGGSCRDIEPTALLLRSGDVVVLAGQSRSCYHGIPRVFTDYELPADVLAAAKQQPEYVPYVQHFRRCRVNISIRSALD